MPNISAPPTDNLMFRKAVQAALDMDEIMDAATDGNYRLNVGFQYPNQPSYTDAGKETYNIKDPAKAKEYLQQAGYKGEPVVLLTNKDYTSMYNAALVMAEQLKAVGINAQLKVVDWPTSVQHGAEAGHRLELLLHRLGHAAGARRAGDHAVLHRRRAPSTSPKDGKDDPGTAGGVERHEQPADPEDRQAAFARDAEASRSSRSTPCRSAR